MEKEGISEFCRNKLWSKSSTSKFLTTKGESFVMNSLSQSDNYASFRKSDDCFLVIRSDGRVSDSLIPRFLRVHNVLVNSGIMKCSCMCHERNGFPCSHMAHVLKNHYKDWDGFSMYDIAIFWWSAKLYYCSTKEQDEVLNKMQEYFQEMENSKGAGVHIGNDLVIDKNKPCYMYGSNSVEVFTSGKVPEVFFKTHINAIETCLNYSSSAISSSMSEFSPLLFGLSQECHYNSSSDEESFNYNAKKDIFHFEERQVSFEECNMKLFENESSAYLCLRESFHTLCKYIDGDSSAVSLWKDKLNDGIMDATKKLNGSNDDSSEVSSLSSNMDCSSSSTNARYVSAYKGQNGLQKRKKRKVLKTKDYK